MERSRIPLDDWKVFEKKVVMCTMHGVLAVGEELRQRPEGVFLIQVHQQDGGNLTHPLAVAHLLVQTRDKIHRQ